MAGRLRIVFTQPPRPNGGCDRSRFWGTVTAEHITGIASNVTRAESTVGWTASGPIACAASAIPAGTL